MGGAGGGQTDQIEAANADEAREILRARGLFVTALTEVPRSRDAVRGEHLLADETSPGQRVRCRSLCWGWFGYLG